MSSFPTVALGELMATKSGSVDPSKSPDELFDLYSIPAFDSRQPEVALGQAIGSSKQIVQPNDVLLSKIVPHIRRTWVVGKGRGRRLIASGEWIVFRSSRVLPDYLRHVLVGDPFHADFMRTVSGVGGSLLRARPAYVAEIKIPLPPLDKQRRIAEVLDRTDALRAKRRAALTQLDSLAQSIFLDVQLLPGNGHLVPLSATAESSRGSFVNGPFGSDLLTNELTTQGIPVIYIRDIRDGEYQRVSTNCVSAEKARKLSVCSVRPGDVLIAKVGDPPGTAAIYPYGAEPAIITQDVVRIRVDPSRYVPEFLVGYLNSEIGRRKVAEITVQATRARFSLRDFKQLMVELPSLPIQKRFASRITAIENLKATQRAALTELDSLFASLQHRAFRGEL